MVKKIVYISLITLGAILLIAIGFLVAKRKHKTNSLNNSKKNLEKQKPETSSN